MLDTEKKGQVLIPGKKMETRNSQGKEGSCSRQVITTSKINPEVNTVVYILLKPLHIVVKILSPSTDVTSADVSFLEAHQ